MSVIISGEVAAKSFEFLLAAAVPIFAAISSVLPGLFLVYSLQYF